jgi:3-methyladenine DNA glycosylase AlkD
MPHIRHAAVEFHRDHPGLTHEDVRAVVDLLYETEFHDLRSAGIALLQLKKDVLVAEDASWLIEIVRRSANWAHVDWLATKIVGRLLARNPQLLKRLKRWARDRDVWVRRTALLAQHDALAAGAGDFDLFERIAVPMLPEREFWIRKAVGWILREDSKKRPELVYRFLREHRAEMSGLTLREGAKHLPGAQRMELLAGRGRSAGLQRAYARSG